MVCCVSLVILHMSSLTHPTPTLPLPSICVTYPLVPLPQAALLAIRCLSALLNMKSISRTMFA